MKKITALLLVIVLLFSIGIITSCSCSPSSTNTAATAATVGKSSNWQEALENTKIWLTNTYTKGDSSIVDKNLKYYILPSDDGETYFVRYTLSTISARDLLVFKNGRVVVIDDDTLDEVKSYNSHYSVDITKVTDDELMKQEGIQKG